MSNKLKCMAHNKRVVIFINAQKNTVAVHRSGPQERCHSYAVSIFDQIFTIEEIAYPTIFHTLRADKTNSFQSGTLYSWETIFS